MYTVYLYMSVYYYSVNLLINVRNYVWLSAFATLVCLLCPCID